MRAAAVFVLSAGVTVPALVHATTAYAADVSATFTTDDAKFGVQIAGRPLWIQVSVLASTAPDAAALASTDALSWQDGNTDTGRPYGYVTDTALRLPEGTPYGSYPVRVEYRLPGGTVQRWTGGTYAHKLHTGVSQLSFDRKTTSLTARTVVLSGKATTWDPVTGTVTPARAGTRVKVSLSTVSDTWKELTGTATTGADGAFSLPFTPNAAINRGTATVVTPAADTVPAAAAPVPEVGVEKTTYRIAAKLNKYRVAQHTNVTVAGRVERLTPDGWKPYAGAPLITTSQKPSFDLAVHGRMGSGVSAANGTFSYGARATHATQVFTSLAPSVYYQSRAYDEGNIAVPQPFSFTNWRITLDEYGRVRGTGRMTTQAWCGEQTVTLQASLDNGRTWRNLSGARASGGTAGYCPFDVSSGGYVNALYRLHHAENDHMVARTTGSVRLGRVPTRFSAFAITPSRPYVDAKMTVSGTLQQRTGGVWKPLKGAKVTLVFKPKGDTQWYWVTRNVTTGSNGKFSFRATNYGDGSWALVKQSANGYFYSETKAKYIDAR
ncbi:hypothetical protein [Streptomyces sp. SJL17-1]|uniref:hypothetical protein n=1 Tax=Streptomyces sp. SJL17-1 TaxID=2967223 RepID=UPI0029671DA8|nr:hypothetical protein [Streptomyces sp. SJL17-1]